MTIPNTLYQNSLTIPVSFLLHPADNSNLHSTMICHLSKADPYPTKAMTQPSESGTELPRLSLTVRAAQAYKRLQAYQTAGTSKLRRATKPLKLPFLHAVLLSERDCVHEMQVSTGLA